MKLSVLLLGLVMVGCVLGTREDVNRRKSEHLERDKTEDVKDSKDKISNKDIGKGKFKMDEKTKDTLVHEKVDASHQIIQKAVEFFLRNPNRRLEHECFEKFKPGESVDFVIDLAPSPTMDKADKLSAQNPIAYYMSLKYQLPSKAYFDSIQMFIDAVTFDLKPEVTHSIIYDNGKKYYIRGEAVEEKNVEKEDEEFVDEKRNLRTMWPVKSKLVSEKVPRIFRKNKLGHVTKLTLWNRDNGLPTVLRASRRSKPVFTIIISDGASGAKLTDLTEDITRTMVIDVGNRRFVKNIEWEETRDLANLVTLVAPQQLFSLVDTCRLLICRACGC